MGVQGRRTGGWVSGDRGMTGWARSGDGAWEDDAFADDGWARLPRW